MGTCAEGSLIKNIASTCATLGGGFLEVNAWIGKRTDLEITKSSVAGQENIITKVENVVGKKCIKITGIKRLLAATSTAVVAENRPNKFTHLFSFEVFERLAADFLNMDQPDDCVVFVELKDKSTTGEGVFLALGLEYGLYTSSDVWDSKASNGARLISLASMAQSEERMSRWVVFGDLASTPSPSYATTKAMLVALETAGA